MLDSVNSYTEGHIMYKSEEAALTLSRYNKERFKMVEAYFVGRDVPIIESFLTSLDVMHHKLANISAILNGHDIIEREDVIDTNEQIMWCYHSVVDDILTKIAGTDPEVIERAIVEQLKKAGPKGLNKKTLKDKLGHEFSFQERKIGRVLRDMVDRNQLIQSEQIVKLSR